MSHEKKKKAVRDMKKGVRVSDEIWTALNLIKTQKQFENYNQVIEYLFKKANINLEKIAEILALLED